MHQYCELDFDYNEQTRDSFRSGELREKWRQKYPMLFDEQDYLIARNQPLYHFFEWQAAILLYEREGLLSLVEKYEFKKHKEQHSLFLELVPNEVINLHKSPPFKNQQLPDLFVYSADKTRWYFCEVKGGRDKFRPVQEKFFTEIEKITDHPIELIKFRLQHE